MIHDDQRDGKWFASAEPAEEPALPFFALGFSWDLTAHTESHSQSDDQFSVKEMLPGSAQSQIQRHAVGSREAGWEGAGGWGLA